MEEIMVKFNSSRAGTVAEIEKSIGTVLGEDVEMKMDPQFDRLKIRADDRVQSRIDKNTAPKMMVANQRGEFHFPPILLRSDHIIIDGNTRTRPTRCATSVNGLTKFGCQVSSNS
jgi:hypothetical protein